MDREQLYKDNEKMVGYIIFKHFDKYRQIYQEELFAEGKCLLWKAITQYTPGEAKLSTYAYQIIYRGLQAFLDKGLGAITIIREQKKNKRYFEIKDNNNKSFDFEYQKKSGDSKKDGSFHDLLGINDQGFYDVEFNLYVEQLTRYFKIMGKCERRYQDTDRIFTLLVNGTHKKLDICNITHHEYPFVQRRLDLIKHDVLEFLKGVDLLGLKIKESKVKKVAKQVI